MLAKCARVVIRIQDVLAACQAIGRDSSQFSRLDGFAVDLRNDLVRLLVKHLKVSRPKTNEFEYAGLGGVQVCGNLQPHRPLFALLSDDVVAWRSHINERGPLWTLTAPAEHELSVLPSY